ncbi:MAG TPA: FliM/FliN family flagellar motor switch protein [Steroidobacteraceae bacterium]|nr:FliM/FliN family flagellar motor switch protein [Steroidobacteraceae bacterium]
MAEADPDAPAISDEEVSALLQPGTPSAVRPYDFSAQRINRTQLPMLEIVAKSFAERATSALSVLLGRDTHLVFESLESVRAPDLQASLPAPGTVAVARLKPLPGLAFVRLDPALLLALLDGFYGGVGQPTADPEAAIAPAAQRFFALILRSMAGDWTAAWASVSTLEFELVKQEINPRLLQLGGQQESVLIARFGVEFGAQSGHLDWLLPDALLAPVRDALAADGGKSAPRKQEPWAPVLAQTIKNADIELRAILTQVQINLGGLVRLAPGDVIPIEAPQEVLLMAGDVPLHRGRFGVSQGRNALKILPGGP